MDIFKGCVIGYSLGLIVCFGSAANHFESPVKIYGATLLWPLYISYRVFSVGEK